MGSFICKQPNGLYCRFSTVVDTITHYNMTEEEYIEMCVEKARKEAEDVLENHLYPFEEIKARFTSLNMPSAEFCRILNEMNQPQGVNK